MKRLLSTSLWCALAAAAWPGCGGKVQFSEGIGGDGALGTDTDTDDDTGSGTGTGSGTMTDTVTSTGVDTGPMTGTGTSQPTGTSTGGGPEECWLQPGDACFGCCEVNYGPEMDAINEKFFDLCLCGPGAPCLMECNNVCGGMAEPNPPCESCINDISNNQDQCILDAVDNCVADPSCAPILECWSGC